MPSVLSRHVDIGHEDLKVITGTIKEGQGLVAGLDGLHSEPGIDQLFEHNRADKPLIFHEKDAHHARTITVAKSFMFADAT